MRSPSHQSLFARRQDCIIIAGRWVARKAIHLIYRARHPTNAPVTYRLPGSAEIRLHPEGEVAEFLSFPRLFERHELRLVAGSLKPFIRIVSYRAPYFGLVFGIGDLPRAFMRDSFDLPDKATTGSCEIFS